ncbi:MAG: ferritin family protein [Sedimentisphaerales bacterium]|jgi:rubrerythrin
MPEFVNPFSGLTPARKLTDSELGRALRLDLAAEEEAVHIYEAHADATDNELAKRVLLDIANEERVHAGEFQRLLNILLKDEEGYLAEGAEEVNEMAREAASGEPTVPGEQAGSEESKSIPTVGDLKQ